MDEHSIEAVFTRAVAETYRQFLEAYNLLDDATQVPHERSACRTLDHGRLDTDLAA